VLANWTLAGDQVHFVQVRIRSSRAATVSEKLQQGCRLLAGQVMLLGAVLTLCRPKLLPGLVVLPFAPVLVRGTLWFQRGASRSMFINLGLPNWPQALVLGTLLCVAFLV
jgi:hypothetical protein